MPAPYGNLSTSNDLTRLWPTRLFMSLCGATLFGPLWEPKSSEGTTRCVVVSSPLTSLFVPSAGSDVESLSVTGISIDCSLRSILISFSLISLISGSSLRWCCDLRGDLGDLGDFSFLSESWMLIVATLICFLFNTGLLCDIEPALSRFEMKSSEVWRGDALSFGGSGDFSTATLWSPFVSFCGVLLFSCADFSSLFSSVFSRSVDSRLFRLESLFRLSFLGFSLSSGSVLGVTGNRSLVARRMPWNSSRALTGSGSSLITPPIDCSTISRDSFRFNLILSTDFDNEPELDVRRADAVLTVDCFCGVLLGSMTLILIGVVDSAGALKGCLGVSSDVVSGALRLMLKVFFLSLLDLSLSLDLVLCISD